MVDSPTIKDVIADAPEYRESIDAAVNRLAALTPAEYEQCRKGEAKKLEVRTSWLDDEVKASRDKGDGGNGFELYEEDMHEFVLPDGLKADITMILNAGHMTEAELDRVVADSGIVIINNWHNGANYMLENCPGYRLVEDITSGTRVYTAALAGSDDANMLFVFQKTERASEEPNID